MTAESEPWIKTAEVARRLGVTSQTVIRLVADGRLPAMKPAGIYLFRPEDVKAAIERWGVAAGAENNDCKK